MPNSGNKLEKKYKVDISSNCHKGCNDRLNPLKPWGSSKGLIDVLDRKAIERTGESNGIETWNELWICRMIRIRQGNADWVTSLWNNDS